MPYSPLLVALATCAVLLLGAPASAASLTHLGGLADGPAQAIAADADRRLTFIGQGQRLVVHHIASDGSITERGSLVLAATIRDCAYDSQRQRVVAALGSAGVAVIALSDPDAPAQIHSYTAMDGSCLAVTVLQEGIAAADDAGPTRLLDHTSLRVRSSSSFTNATDLARAGDRLVQLRRLRLEIHEIAGNGSFTMLEGVDAKPSAGGGGSEQFQTCTASEDLLVVPTLEVSPGGGGHSIAASVVRTYTIANDGTLSVHSTMTAGRTGLAGCAVDDRRVYVTSDNASWTLRAYNADPGDTGRSWDWHTGIGSAAACVVLGDHVLVAAAGDGLVVVDRPSEGTISDRAAATPPISRTHILSNTRAVAIADSQLLLVDISDASTPRVIDRIDDGTRIDASHASEGLIVVGVNNRVRAYSYVDDSLTLAAASDQIGSLNVVQAVAITNGRIYAGLSSSGLAILRRDGENLEQVAIDDLGLSRGVQAIAIGPTNVLYPIVESYGLVPLDISDPDAPQAHVPSARYSFASASWSSDAGVLVSSDLGLSRFATGDPLATTGPDRIHESGSLKDTIADDDRALLLLGAEGIAVHRVDAGNASIELATYATPGPAIHGAQDGDLVLVACDNGGLQLYRFRESDTSGKRTITIRSSADNRPWDCTPAPAAQSHDEPAGTTTFEVHNASDHHRLTPEMATRSG